MTLASFVHRVAALVLLTLLLLALQCCFPLFMLNFVAAASLLLVSSAGADFSFFCDSPLFVSCVAASMA